MMYRLDINYFLLNIFHTYYFMSELKMGALREIRSIFPRSRASYNIGIVTLDSDEGRVDREVPSPLAL